MSRIANSPVLIPGNVEVNLSKSSIKIKGSKGELMHDVHPLVSITQEDNVLTFATQGNSKMGRAVAGTTRAIVQNIVIGVAEGFVRKLTIIGIGYRAKVDGRKLNLTLGFSHPVNFDIPEGIEIEMPSQTEIIVKGINKQKVGQAAANIRAYRPPEPYKGKGIRYADEIIVRKEAKKS